MKTRFALLVSMLVFSLPVLGQEFQNGYFLGGYNMAFRMNPAIQNERSIFALGLGNVGAGATSNQFGTDAYLHKVGNELVSAFDNRVDADAVLGKISKNKNNLGLGANVDILTLGFWSGRNYVTVDVRARADMQVSAPYDLFVLAKTPKSSQPLDLSGTALKLNGIVETAVGFSHNFDNVFNVGGRFKFLYGVMSAGFKMDSMTATPGQDCWTFSGNGTLVASSEGFRAKDNGDGYISLDSLTDDFNGEGLKKPAGFGAAIDLGATWNALPWLTVSGALLDLGAMSWKRSVYGETPSSYEWVMEPEDDGSVNGGDAIGTLLTFKKSSSGGSVSSAMPITVNLGAEAFLPSYDRLSFGLLTTVRHSQVCSWAEGRLYTNWNPWNAFSLTASTTLNNFGQFLGFAMNLHPGGINFFLGTDYIPLKARPFSYFNDDKDTPAIIRNMVRFPTDRLNINLYFGLNLAFGKRHLDYRRRIIN